MKKIWIAQIDLNCEEASLLIRNQFPQFSFRNIVKYKSGFDNQAFLLDKKWIFRFPRREIASTLITNEVSSLQHIAPFIPHKIPCYEFVGKKSDSFPWPFCGYRIIKGTTGCETILCEHEKNLCARQLGIFLRNLHSIPQNFIEKLYIEQDRIRRYDIPYRIETFKEKWNSLHQLGKIFSLSPLLPFLTKVESVNLPSKLTIVHGDLYFRHLIFNNKHLLKGIIDWGDIHIGHAWWDIAMIFGEFNHEQRNYFFEEYGNISPEEILLARFSDLNRLLALAHYSIDIEDHNLEQCCFQRIHNEMKSILLKDKTSSYVVNYN